MTTFYFGPSARITQDAFEVRRPFFKSFSMAELTAIHIEQEARPATVYGKTAKVGSLALVAIGIVVGLIAWSAAGSATVALVALSVTVVSSAVSAGCWRAREDSAYEIRALYRGRPVCLLRTDDQRLLGQVSRGLLRALERNVDSYR